MSNHRQLARVALVERFRLVTQALDLALATTCSPIPIPVQNLYSSGEVLAAILRRPVDVVVLGPALGGSIDPEQLVADLAARGCPVVALADHELARARLHRVGATATALVSDGLAGVRQAIEAAVRASGAGTATVDPVPPDPRRLALQRLGSLSRREVAVLDQLGRGRTATQIARAHVVSELTVRSQIKNILHKLDVGTQLAAVALAHGAGWEPPYPEAA